MEIAVSKMTRDMEIERTLAMANELILTRLGSSKSEKSENELSVAVREIAEIRTQMLTNPEFDPVEQTRAVEIFLELK